MGLFDNNEEKKRAKEIRKEGKGLRKDLLNAGLDKRRVDTFLEEYLPSLERACVEREAYQNARLHMESCMELIHEILPKMRELSSEDCKVKLMRILDELALVYHDCLVRKDDMDFDSTYQYMKRKIPAYAAEERLMMQSELENLQAVFEDALCWVAPEFLALAYYLRHERSECFADMENSQRNNYIEHYYKEQFWDSNVEEIEKADMLERILQFEKEILAK